ncbi:hypothetical protein K435DRAFT_71130 [Dendrothele bispora CBS 962.96]|uniref:Uncharacterized protein n=1 Tax=Dendrothele bispora (strain CBS 962.96) TaxID=1314807 RepID=A0A4S8KQE4_DENBC|nr:hypothetical protein K435DRAFT_71130 [Dendrothele bispora CBS 962.96]
MPLSVFPHCTLGLYGVAEKAAAMILQTASTSPPLPSPTSTSCVILFFFSSFSHRFIDSHTQAF